LSLAESSSQEGERPSCSLPDFHVNYNYNEAVGVFTDA
jgi:hypothetical protein